MKLFQKLRFKHIIIVIIKIVEKINNYLNRRIENIIKHRDRLKINSKVKKSYSFNAFVIIYAVLDFLYTSNFPGISHANGLCLFFMAVCLIIMIFIEFWAYPYLVAYDIRKNQYSHKFDIITIVISIVTFFAASSLGNNVSIFLTALFLICLLVIPLPEFEQERIEKRNKKNAKINYIEDNNICSTKLDIRITKLEKDISGLKDKINTLEIHEQRREHNISQAHNHFQK